MLAVVVEVMAMLELEVLVEQVVQAVEVLVAQELELQVQQELLI
jgi:hypothetical protein